MVAENFLDSLAIRESFLEVEGRGWILKARIGMRSVETLKAGETIWDTMVVGFGARRQAGVATYILRYRTSLGGRQRTFSIGKHGSPWSPEDARAEAIRLLRIVVDGGDPSADRDAARKAVSIAELCDEYLADAEAGRLLTRRRIRKAASTISTDRSRVEAHIKPLIGHLPVAAITRHDVERMMHDIVEGKTKKRSKLAKPHALSNIRGGRGAASRTVGLLGAILTYAVRRGLRPDNPCHDVMRPADGRRDRRLDDSEYRVLGEALIAAVDDGVWSSGIAAIRFLVLTGWRRGEALMLRWTDIDLDRRSATLSDTKTGRSIRPLANSVCALLREMPQGDYVFPASWSDEPMRGFARIWTRVVHKFAGLSSDVTPHVLRHSYASVAADIGLADATIGGLLGHAGHSITRRYIHVADESLLAAADGVADQIKYLMTPKGEELVQVEVKNRDENTFII